MHGESRLAVYQHGVLAGTLHSVAPSGWSFAYEPEYEGPPVSLTLPVRAEAYPFVTFPPFLEGLLPEGMQLETLLRTHKIDRNDPFRQLVTVGEDVVGSLTVREIKEDA